MAVRIYVTTSYCVRVGCINLFLAYGPLPPKITVANPFFPIIRTTLQKKTIGLVWHFHSFGSAELDSSLW